MKFLVNSVLVVAIAALAVAKPTTSEIDTTNGELLPDYKCTEEGVFSDPAECDCYIVCNQKLVAYRMTCEKKNGLQQFYMQSFTLSHKGDICGSPSVAGCPLRPTTEKPELPLTPCGNTTEGDDCDPLTDCNQCGYCDEYMYCKKTGPTTGTWTRLACAIRGDPDLVHRSDKLFWNQGSTAHGGRCAPWDDLSGDLQDGYLSDPLCKPPCEFQEDDVCGQVYHYRDPDINKDIWKKVEWERLVCPTGSAWDQEDKTCVFCDDPADPTCNCV